MQMFIPVQPWVFLDIHLRLHCCEQLMKQVEQCSEASAYRGSQNRSARQPSESAFLYFLHKNMLDLYSNIRKSILQIYRFIYLIQISENRCNPYLSLFEIRKKVTFNARWWDSPSPSATTASKAADYDLKKRVQTEGPKYFFHWEIRYIYI